MNDCLIVAGGIIPREDIPLLKEQGIAEVFLPGPYAEEMVKFLREHVHPRT